MAKPLPRLPGLQTSSHDPESWTRFKQGVRGLLDSLQPAQPAANDGDKALQRVEKAEEAWTTTASAGSERSGGMLQDADGRG